MIKSQAGEEQEWEGRRMSYAVELIWAEATEGEKVEEHKAHKKLPEPSGIV
jgi:hypothetical protein